MRGRLAFALLPLVLSLLCLPAWAGTVREEDFGVSEVERSAAEQGGTAEYGAGLDDGLAELVDTGTRELAGIIRRAVRSSVLILLILLFCGLAETVQEGAGGSPSRSVSLAGTLAVTAVAVADVNALLGMGTGAIARMTSFANVLLPTAAALTAATGAVTGAAARQLAAALFSDLLVNLIHCLPTAAALTAATGAVTGAAARQLAAALFSDLLVNLIHGLLVPLLYGYIAASAAQAAVGENRLKRLADLLKWTVTTVLTVVTMAFVGYLTASGVVAGTADAATVKAAKFAISGAIPVVGGILSDAAETVLASAGILKGTVGVFGMVTILGICLIPLLQLAVHYLAYKLTAALASALGDGPVCGLVDRLGGAFGLVLGMTGACCLLLLIALVSCVSVAAL